MDMGTPAPRQLDISAPRGTRRWRRVFFILAAIGFVGIVAVELFLRFYIGLGDPPIYQTDSRYEYIIKPGIYHRFGHTVSYNRWSMRSADIEPKKTDPRELRILVIGDSIVNGGSPTADAELATTLLEPTLSKELGRPVRVLNISMGSWGPRNMLGYLESFGTFDADIAVIVLNSIDYGDEPTFAPLTSEQPTSKPLLAIQEAITNYLPRAIEKLKGEVAAEEDINPPADRGEKSLQSLRELVGLLRSRGMRVVAVQHLRRDEAESVPFVGQAKIKATLDALSVATLHSVDWFKPHYTDAEPVLRDAAHPNARGQKILAEVLHAAIKRGMADGAYPASATPPPPAR